MNDPLFNLQRATIVKSFNIICSAPHRGLNFSQKVSEYDQETAITHRGPTHGTVRKSHRTIVLKSDFRVIQK